MKVVSVDVGAHSIKFCECEVRKKHLEVLKVTKVPLANPEKPIEFQMDDVAAQVARSLASNHSRYDRLILGISSSLCSFRFTELPFTSKKRIDEVLPMEMEDLVPFSSDEMIIDYQVIQVEKKITELLAVMVPSVHYENYLTAFSDLDVESDVVMPDAVGLSLFLEHYLPETHQTEVAIDIGYRHSTMAFIREKKMVYLRSVPFGYTSFSRHIQEKTNYTPEEVHNLISQYDDMAAGDQKQYEPILDDALTQLVVEANQTLVAYKAKTKEQIGNVYISGGFGGFKYIIPTLSGEFPHPVQSMNILSNVVTSNSPIDLHEYVVAIGYASRYQAEDPRVYLNFRRKETKASKIIEGLKKYFDKPETQKAWRAAMILLAVFIPYLIAKSIIVNIHYEKSTKQADRFVKKAVSANLSKKKRRLYINQPDKLIRFLDKEQRAGQMQVSIFQKDHILFTELLYRITQQLSKNIQVDVDVFEFNQNKARIVFKVIKGNIQPLIENIKNISMVAKINQQNLSETLTEVNLDLKLKK